MSTKWIKWGVATAALVVVTGLGFGAQRIVQAQDAGVSLTNQPAQIALVAWKGAPQGPMRPGARGAFGFMPTVAATLGISDTTLMDELRSGKSVADVAQEKNVELSKVVDAIVAKQTDALKQAVTDGKITQQQADDRLAKLKTVLPTMLSQKLPAMGPGRGFGPGGAGMMGPANFMPTVASTLGISDTALLRELRSGKSVADVAKEKNVDLSKVVDAIVAKQTDALKQAVTDGKITQQQADDRLAKLKTNLPTMLSQKLPAMGPGRGFGHGGAGMQGQAGFGPLIASTLGISETTLATELRSGKSVADVAQEKNVDLSKVVDAIVAKQTDALKQAVTDGRITQAQADQRLATLKANLPHLLSLKYGMGGMMGPGRGFGGRGFRQPGLRHRQAPDNTQQSSGPEQFSDPAQSA